MKFKRVFLLFTLILFVLFVILFLLATHWYFTFSYTTTRFNDFLEENIETRLNQPVSMREVTISPRRGIEIHDFRIANKLGFSEEYFLSCARVQIPIHFGSVLKSLAKKELVLDTIFLDNPRIFFEITLEEGINFPNAFPVQFLEPLSLFIYENIPIHLDIEKITLNRPEVQLTYLNRPYGTLFYEEIVSSLLDDQILNIKFQGKNSNLDGFSTQSFHGNANIILQEIPIGAGDITIHNVFFEKPPFSEQFERFFRLPPIRRQLFAKMQLHFNLSDRALIISNLSGQTSMFQFHLSGNIDFEGFLDLRVRYTYPSATRIPEITEQSFTVNVTGDLIHQEFSY